MKTIHILDEFSRPSLYAWVTPLWPVQIPVRVHIKIVTPNCKRRKQAGTCKTCVGVDVTSTKHGVRVTKPKYINRYLLLIKEYTNYRDFQQSIPHKPWSLYRISSIEYSVSNTQYRPSSIDASRKWLSLLSHAWPTPPEHVVQHSLSHGKGQRKWPNLPQCYM